MKEKKQNSDLDSTQPDQFSKDVRWRNLVKGQGKVCAIWSHLSLWRKGEREVEGKRWKGGGVGKGEQRQSNAWLLSLSATFESHGRTRRAMSFVVLSFSEFLSRRREGLKKKGDTRKCTSGDRATVPDHSGGINGEWLWGKKRIGQAQRGRHKRRRANVTLDAKKSKILSTEAVSAPFAVDTIITSSRGTECASIGRGRPAKERGGGHRWASRGSMYERKCRSVGGPSGGGASVLPFAGDAIDGVVVAWDREPLSYVDGRRRIEAVVVVELLAALARDAHALTATDGFAYQWEAQ
ncbi:hypothetical protein BDK51DRAFT_31072 [Blyttiomyces helicus]|uniref:Uncharacterized protein n=1 Tax=Blyttiomyces helicus TaxID=388810 RepID=A0A4P9WP19_9FUNG|nr:hypothetical protein BDK51DRAFT_31072 [Blyttiomyces helicus]|eukprot:RKO94232.1 hypothetical protein BDK51DRAFT_31072 [Blyttiomyces helicus]